MGSRFRRALKRLIKIQGHTYEHVAQVWRCSVPTVKRVMTRDEMSLERLIRLCDWLQVPLHELVTAATEDPRAASVLTDAQEELLATDPVVYVYYHAILVGRPIESLRRRWKLTRKEEIHAQNRLDDVGLIEVWPGDRLRLTVRGPFNMQADGPLQRTYFPAIAKAILKRFEPYLGAYHDAPSLAAPVLFRPFEMVLRPEVYLEMTKELRDVVNEYRLRSRTEMTLERPENLRHVSGVIAADFYYAWDDALEPLANRQRRSKR